MNNSDNIELVGVERDKAIAAVLRQIAKWGLKMPCVEPHVLHFGLNRFREIGTTEFCIANEADHGYCGKFLFVFDGQACPAHFHRLKHETFFVVKGSIRMHVGVQEFTMREGDAQVMPPEVEHSFTGLGPALILEASTPASAEDSVFIDPRVPEGIQMAGIL